MLGSLCTALRQSVCVELFKKKKKPNNLAVPDPCHHKITVPNVYTTRQSEKQPHDGNMTE